MQHESLIVKPTGWRKSGKARLLTTNSNRLAETYKVIL
ncbi:MAG: hypothetical protein ACI81F_002543 [Thalassolituus oleivorans]